MDNGESVLSGKKILVFDPEGGHMFIEEFVPSVFPTPKVVVCV